MAEIPTRVGSMGRVTIPARERDALDIEHGDYVLVEVTPLEVTPRTDDDTDDATEAAADGD